MLGAHAVSSARASESASINSYLKVYQYSPVKYAAAFDRKELVLHLELTVLPLRSRSRDRSGNCSGGLSSACISRYSFTQEPGIVSFTFSAREGRHACSVREHRHITQSS
jgi:hypothetical protein